MTHASLERALKGAKAFVKEKGWSSRAEEFGILVNLTKVEWCDLSAVVRLVLFVEAALRDRLKVKIVLPFPQARGSEQVCLQEFQENRWHKSFNELTTRIDRRARALGFLRYIDFESAVTCSHLNLPKGQLEIEDHTSPKSFLDESETDEDDPFLRPGASNETEQEPEEFPLHEKTYEHVLPLRWWHTPDLNSIKQELDRLRNFLIGIVGGKQRGILRFDAEALTNVIFHELIQNTKEHANVTHCLVGAWCRKPGQSLSVDEYHKDEHSFFTQWVRPNRFPLVDIAIGDSGVGIPTSLNQVFSRQQRPWEGVPQGIESATEQVLFWSLGRWSTRAGNEDRLRRGTRGLHRVHRLVKGYTGLLTVRSETSLVGWNHGGHDVQAHFNESGLARVPGTSLSIRLPVMMKAEEPIQSPAIEDRLMDFTVAQPLVITIDGLSQQSQDDLAEKLSRGASHRHRSVVAIIRDIPENPDERKVALGNAFEQMKNLVTPGALTVLAPGISPDDLDVHVDSFTQVTDEAVRKERQKRHIGSQPDYYEITDLFSVVDANLKTRWTGGNVNEVTLLEQIQQSTDSCISEQEITKLFPEPFEKHEVLGDLKEQLDLFKFHQDGSISLRFNTSDVFKYVRECVSTRLEDLLDDPLGLGVESRGPFLSPSLIYVDKWLAMSRVLGEFGWFWITDDLLERVSKVAGKKQLAYIEEQRERAIPSFKELINFVQEQVPRQELAKVGQKPLAKAAHLPFGADFVLWALAATIAQVPEYRPERIVCDSLVHTGGPEQLAAFLGISDQYTILPRLSLLGELPDLLGDFADKKVLVFCDLILSGNSPRQVLEQVIRQGAKPTAIACILDFRPEPVDYLEFAGLRIPIISLVHASQHVLSTGPENFRYIDAVTGHPETGFDEFSQTLSYSIERKLLEKYVNRTSALYFNHIIRPARHGSYYHQYEHFTFYLDADRFLSDPECLATTREALWNEINKFLKEHGGDPQAETRVLYVSNDEVHGDRAKELLRAPQTSGSRSQLSPTAIPRWGLPEAITIRDRNVVIVDWNAQTGKTISRLMYLAAAGGAHAVLGVVLLSRMSEEEEYVLRSIDRMRVLSKPPTFESLANNLFEALDSAAEKDRRKTAVESWHSVPVRVIFLSQARIHQSIESDCPICTQRQRVMGERGELERFPTQHLRKFISDQMEGLRPRQLHEARGSEHLRQQDCFGSPISADRATIMFRFREGLDLAMHSTKFRAQVAAYLRDVRERLDADPASALAEAEAILYLLATELQWFKLPPLHFYDLREVLAGIAYKFLTTSDPKEASQHALIVMRSAHKLSFARNIGTLAPRFLDRPEMLMQMLYDSFTMIDAPYHDKATLTPLVSSLDSLVKAVTEYRKADTTDRLEVHAAAQAVFLLGVRRLGFADSEESNIVSDWAAAKELLEVELGDAHSTVGKIYKVIRFGNAEQAWEQLRQPISDPSTWDGVRTKWADCQDLLERRLFRYIRTCWQIFEGPYAESYTKFDAGDLQFLKDICLNTNSTRIRRINDLLSEFSATAPSPGPAWSEFKSIRSLLLKLILGIPNEKSEGAQLRRFMQSCPTDLIEVISAARATPVWRDDVRPEFAEHGFSRLLVFCHKRIVDDLIEELFRNATVHKPTSADNPVRVRVSVNHVMEKDVVELLFLYSGTDPNFRDPDEAGEGGQGLNKLEKALEPYDAQIDHARWNDPVNEWDYFTRVTFKFGGV